VKDLPKYTGDKSLLLRTEFSNNPAWAALCKAVAVPSEEGFLASLDCISDPAYAGLSAEKLLTLKAKDLGHYFMFLADKECLTSPEFPILVVDLNREPGRTFRVIPSETWGVENNLSISNMDFYEFADRVDKDGVFRGFK